MSRRKGFNIDCPLLLFLWSLLLLGTSGDGQQQEQSSYATDACTELEPGDIQIISFNSQDPDEIYFLALENIVPSVGSIYVTTDTWNGVGFAASEGTIRFQIPNFTFYFNRDGSRERCDGICKGGEFFFKASMVSTKEGNLTTTTSNRKRSWHLLDKNKNFGLNEKSGDSLLTYCLRQNHTDNNDKPHFLHALTFAKGGWASSFPTQQQQSSIIHPSQTIVPASLLSNEKKAAFIELSYAQKYEFEGNPYGDKRQIQERLMDQSNWKGSNKSRERTENEENLLDFLWSFLAVASLVFGSCTWYYKRQKKRGGTVISV